MRHHFNRAYANAHLVTDKLERMVNDSGKLNTAELTLPAVDSALSDMRTAICALSAVRNRLAGNPEPVRGE